MAIFRQLSPTVEQNSRTVKQEIVSAGETISELKKKAADCEEKAKQAAEPEAEKLREEAVLYREWIARCDPAHGIRSVTLDDERYGMLCQLTGPADTLRVSFYEM